MKTKRGLPNAYIPKIIFVMAYKINLATNDLTGGAVKIFEEVEILDLPFSKF